MKSSKSKIAESDLLGLKNPVGLGWKNLQELKNPAGFGWKTILTAFVLICGSACDNDKIYQEEQYQNVVCLLSGAENVYTEVYTLNETEPVRYFSVVCGGSKPNTEEVVVTFEHDHVLLDQYNKNNFDVDESKYAQMLTADRYEIASYTATIPANPVDQYVKVPVIVRPLGLSPDSTYFIPIAIKSVSRYEVNEEKYNMLYRVTIENDYAQQRTTTYYTKKGTELNQSNNNSTVLSGLKTVQPLTKEKVRMFAGNYLQSQTTTVTDIERYAIVVEVNEDNTLDITPYGTIEVEKLDADDYNLYDPEVMQGTKTQRVFFLYYRYRTLNANGTYSAWMEVKESLTRVEED